MRSKNNQNPIIRLYLNLIEERRLLIFAFLSSIINKILDLAPPVIIGLAVDIVVKEQNSWIAGFGIKEVPAQLIFLAFASGIVGLVNPPLNIYIRFYGEIWLSYRNIN